MAEIKIKKTDGTEIIFEDRIAIFTAITSILLIVTPIRDTIIIICLTYLTIYTIYKIYRNIKINRAKKGKWKQQKTNYSS